MKSELNAVFLNRIVTSSATMQIPISWIISFLILIFVLGGCMYHSTGLKMTDERVAFIQNGVTTREEIVETFGPPLYELEAERIFAYYWERRNAGVSYNMFGKGGENEGKFERWLYIVHCDNTNRVNRHGKTLQLPTETAQETMLRWLKEKTTN